MGIYDYLCRVRQRVEIKDKDCGFWSSKQAPKVPQKGVPLRNGGAPLGKWRGLTCQNPELETGFLGVCRQHGVSRFKFLVSFL